MTPLACVLMIYVAGIGPTSSSAEHAYFATSTACHEAQQWLMRSGDGRVRAECFPTGVGSFAQLQERE